MPNWKNKLFKYFHQIFGKIGVHKNKNVRV